MISDETAKRLEDINAEVLELRAQYSGDNLSEDLLWLYTLKTIESIVYSRAKLLDGFIELYTKETMDYMVRVSLYFKSSYVRLREERYHSDTSVSDIAADFNYSENELLNELKDIVFEYEEVYKDMQKHKANKFLEDVLYTLGEVPF